MMIFKCVIYLIALAGYLPQSQQATDTMTPPQSSQPVAGLTKALGGCGASPRGGSLASAPSVPSASDISAAE